ncbi:TPA: DNA alkylation repair protein [Candidatus Falkowbacteria bacterium]|nr:DNA alkylation repair protein [Candidatus Falkowbacteria bacterium]
MSASDVVKELKALKDPKKANNLAWFFKTGKGEYGEGDKFLGIVMGDLRQIAKKYCDLPLTEVQKLVVNPYHEIRMAALLVLVYKVTDLQKLRILRTREIDSLKQIYDFYLKNTKYINNWDLVDVTTPQIVGNYLVNRDRKILYKLAKSKSLWEKRIAVLATFSFIKNRDFHDALKIAEVLLNDNHDLIHKAVGWMLREVGKRDPAEERAFLDKHGLNMPRTMLRYAIEKFPEPMRQKYLKRKS